MQGWHHNPLRDYSTVSLTSVLGHHFFQLKFSIAKWNPILFIYTPFDYLKHLIFFLSIYILSYLQLGYNISSCLLFNWAKCILHGWLHWCYTTGEFNVFTSYNFPPKVILKSVELLITLFWIPHYFSNFFWYWGS